MTSKPGSAKKQEMSGCGCAGKIMSAKKSPKWELTSIVQRETGRTGHTIRLQLSGDDIPRGLYDYIQRLENKDLEPEQTIALLKECMSWPPYGMK